jgi:hypothetical protein
MVGLLNPTTWLVGLAVLAGAYGTGRFQQWRADDEAATAVRLANVQKAREREAQWQIDLETINDAHLDTLAGVAAALGDAERKLRQRPERMPADSAPACAGGTGAELSRPDAEFLSREAARADRLRAELSACTAWVEAVRRDQ